MRYVHPNLDSKRNAVRKREGFDRGVAELEMGEYFAAISDFDSAIRRKDPSDNFLPSLYEYKGMPMLP